MLLKSQVRFHAYSALLPPRFRLFVEAPDEHGCWTWTGPVGPDGYGIGASNRTAHAWSFRLHRGPYKSATQKVVQTCDNRLCVNPHHLVLKPRW